MEELFDSSAPINRFIIRVYGIAVNEKDEILLCNEQYGGINITKFPGGGLEFGEGILDCLFREFKEELNASLENVHHFYTTDFFQQSAFRATDQLISVYYIVKMQNDTLTYPYTNTNLGIHFYWKSRKELHENEVTFPIDKLVINKLANIIV